jgi:hypothetical protein
MASNTVFDEKHNNIGRGRGRTHTLSIVVIEILK